VLNAVSGRRDKWLCDQAIKWHVDAIWIWMDNNGAQRVVVGASEVVRGKQWLLNE
jgi:hypothetical protein